MKHLAYMKMVIFITTAMEPAIRRKLDYLCFLQSPTLEISTWNT